MQLTITMELDNAAFEASDNEADGAEVARILRILAAKYMEHNLFPEMDVAMYDRNGNLIGQAIVS